MLVAHAGFEPVHVLIRHELMSNPVLRSGAQPTVLRIHGQNIFAFPGLNLFVVDGPSVGAWIAVSPSYFPSNVFSRMSKIAGVISLPLH